MPRLGHGSGHIWAPSSSIGLHASCPQTQAFGTMNTGFQTMEPCLCRLGRSGGWPCASLTGIWPSRACANVRPIWPIAHYSALPRSDSNGHPALLGAWICLGRWWSGGFPTSSGGSRSYNSGSKTMPWARIGIANVPLLTASKCCILAALEVVGGDDKARSMLFLTSCLSYAYLTCLPTWPA